MSIRTFTATNAQMLGLAFTGTVAGVYAKVSRKKYMDLIAFAFCDVEHY
jgi:hypothetical protein